MSTNVLNRSAELLVRAVQDLSSARSVERIREIVRGAARHLADADGATFVLRDGESCHYVDEDAIGPLWKGRRFPMTACISGWAMLHRSPAVVPDIFRDPRIPVDAYEPTFVRSLVMVPIREDDPIGAIGVYWARSGEADPGSVEMLRALANTTAVAMENVRVYQELEERVRTRTAELEAANAELDAFAHSVSHDLRAPLRHVAGFTRHLQEHAGPALDDQGRHFAQRIVAATDRMARLIDDMLGFARSARAVLAREPIDLREAIRSAQQEVLPDAVGRDIQWQLPGESLVVKADARLLHQALVNLLSNAVKYTRGLSPARIEVGVRTDGGDEVALFVKDNGVGFDPAHADRLFDAFQRLHSPKDFEGTGVGLANVRRIVQRHGGRTWADGAVNGGATFWIALPLG